VGMAPGSRRRLLDRHSRPGRASIVG
jgi:hypothetical protein